MIAIFVGGPADGEIMQLPDQRDRWRVPVRAFTNLADEPMHIAVYDLAIGPMGRPSLDDQGRHRYTYSYQEEQP